MKLAIVGDLRHSRDARGRLCTLSPVVRQLKPWLERFDEVVACCTYQPGPPPPTHEPYSAPVQLRALPRGGGDHLSGKLGLLRRVVQWWGPLRSTLRECDVVHFRCPCNVALVGIAASRGLRVRRFAMYAGNWAGYPGESPFYRLQRRWLASARFDGPVAVYGPRAGEGAHVLASFSPSFTEAQWRADGDAVARKLELCGSRERLMPLRIVSVGHLNRDKDQATLIRAVARLQARGQAVELELLGDGPQRPVLERLARDLGLEAAVRFRGRVSLEEVRASNLGADVAVLASRTEGFPKVLAEAMAAGAVPVASDVGLNREILRNGSRGLLFPFGDDAALADRLTDLARQPLVVCRMASAGREYTRGITLEAFEAAQHRILTDWLAVPAPSPAPRPQEVPA